MARVIEWSRWLTIGYTPHAARSPRNGRGGHQVQSAGLGLSLAAAVARLHGGTITLSDNRPGLRVAIDLPAVPAAE